MDELQITERPTLRRPILIVASAGWADAGESATMALRFMVRRWKAEVFAELDPEPFYDFTQARPRVRLQQGERVLEWPQNQFAAHRVEDGDRDVILFQGTEPHLAWHAYTQAVMGLCDEFGVSAMITLGAFRAEVSHARPARVTGSSADPVLREQMGLTDASVSRYQGPTGITGVLDQAARDAEIATASLWTSVPLYIEAAPNPKGALALLERLNSGFGLGLTLHDLEVFGARFDAQVATAVAQNPEMADYARRLEEREQEGDAAEEPQSQPEDAGEPLDPKAMVDDIERFLREQRDQREEEREEER